jgi:enediyne biosynthesis protein E4
VTRRDFVRRALPVASLSALSSSFSVRRESLALAPPASPVQFTDITSQAKIAFKHTTGATGQKYLMETMGSGCAFLDFDGDGYLDIYFVNGGILPGFTPSGELRNALYRNNGDGTFTDVTEKAGVQGHGYGMGVVAGDYNNDGFPDLFVTNFGSSILYRNNGDGTFTEVTERAGVNNKLWGTSAAFFDYDNDGFLDLFVCNYVDYSLANNTYCGTYPKFRAYCSPDNFTGVGCVLYHNNGDGTFTDVSERAGIAGAKGKSLGVVTADFNGDGYQDIFVANDQVANFLFLNNKDGTFQEIATLAGAGYTANGTAQSGMGVAAGDYDGDGKLDVFVTDLSFQGYSLFHNDGDQNFSDASSPSGVGPASLLLSGWGVVFADYDNDGDEDIFAVSGHVMDNVERLSPNLRYFEPALLLENVGGKFINATPSHGETLSVPRVSRGLAAGDFNNDGNIDFLISNTNTLPTLLKNEGGSGNNFLMIHAVGKKSNRDGIGVTVKLSAGGRTQRKEILGGGSYLSSSDRRLHFGVGKNDKIERLDVRWPSGVTQVLENIPANQILKIVEPWKG